MRSGPRVQLRRRVEELGLDPAGYVERLSESATERARAELLLSVTISRFYRDRALWTVLRTVILPPLARLRHEVRLWSAGTACGEEAHGLALVWEQSEPPPGSAVRIVATDIRRDCLERARLGVYPESSLRDLPVAVRRRYFRRVDRGQLLDGRIRAQVHLAVHDLARDPWPRELDLIALRNVVFTYWSEERQLAAVERAAVALKTHCWLAIGDGERLPPGSSRWFEGPLHGAPLYRRRD